MLPKKVTILYPIIHYPPVIGGIEQWAKNIAERQPKNVDVIIITGRVRGVPDVEKSGGVTIIRKSLLELGDFSHSSRIYILGAFPFILVGSIIAARKYNVSLVHCHGFVSAVMGFLVSRSAMIDFIGTEQSVGWASSKTKFLRSFVYKRARVCIASSEAVKKEFSSIGVQNVSVIPNGVDLSRFSPAKEGRILLGGPKGGSDSSLGAEPGFNILSVGRLEKVKGHEFLIYGFSNIKKKIPEAKLIIVGNGSERKNLADIVSRLGISDSVKFIGEIPHDNLPEYFKSSDVFVMPSLSEGFGIAVIEAMASGVPIVASRVDALEKIIEDRKTGILVEPGSAFKIEEALVFLRDNPDKGREFRSAALEKVKEYSWNNIAKRVADLYDGLAKDLSNKVLFVTSIFPPDIGGPAVYAEKLRDELLSFGYEVEVAKGKNSRSFLRVYQRAKDNGIIYVLTSSPRILLPAFIICKFLGRKIAVRLGGDYIWERAVENRKADCSLSKFYGENRLIRVEKVIAYFLGVILRRCDAVIFTTEFQRNIYEKNFDLKGKNVCVIENAYPDYTKSLSRNFPDEPLKILYAGRIIRLKNLELLVRAFSRLKKERKENIILEIVGEGSDAQNLMAEARNCGVSESIIFEASLPREKILEKLENAWIAVLPSYSEISPNFALEACAARMPVIVTKECGLPEEIMNKLLAFNPMNEYSLFAAMEKMLKRDEWAKYQNVLTNFDMARTYKIVAEEHNNLFKNI